MAKNNFILVYALSDTDKANEFADTLKNEEGICPYMPFSEIDDACFNDDVFERLCSPVIDDANFLLFLASDNSRKSLLCLRSIKYANDLNKRILVARCDKGGIFQNWIKNEWNFTDKVYSWLDADSQAELTAILREWTGCELIPGDRVGAKVSFSSTNSPSKFFLYKEVGSQWKEIFTKENKKNSGLSYFIVSNEEATEDLCCRLERGKYRMHYQSSKYPKRVNAYGNFEIKTNSDHQEFSIDLVDKVAKHESYVKEQEEKRAKYSESIFDTYMKTRNACSRINEHLSYLKNHKMKKIAPPHRILVVVSLLLALFYWFNAQFRFCSIILFDYIKSYAYHSDSFIFTFILTAISFYVVFYLLFKFVVVCCEFTFQAITDFRITYTEWKLEPATNNRNYYSSLYDRICGLGRNFTPRFFEDYDGYPDEELSVIVKKYGSGGKVYHRHPFNALSHIPMSGIGHLWLSCMLWLLFIYVCGYLLRPGYEFLSH